MASPIEDYAIIGDGRTSALVARDGSIDWWCLPRADSPSIFAALLDPDRGGGLQWRIEDAQAVTRRYLPGTNVLETRTRCARGAVRVVDAMQSCPREAHEGETVPDHELVRLIECTDGEAAVDVRIRPRPDCGRRDARLRQHGSLGIAIEAGAQSLLLRSDLPLEIEDGRRAARGRAVLRCGERRWIALAQTTGPGVLPMIGADGAARLERTIAWWRDWTARCRLPSIWTEQVERSALALKLLVYPPSGAVLAAATTSLPETIGGSWNWDYRYCWVRDAAFTMRALLHLGIREEADAFFSWLLQATRLSWPALQVLYDVHGRRHVPERELGWLAGYRGSRPVRTGNAARGQRQLDVYGSLLDAAWQYHRAGGRLDRGAGRMLRGFVETARDRWRLPDAGIWERRTGERHHTLSKAMCWVAMERGLRLARAGVLDLDEGRLRGEMRAVVRAVEDEGYDASLGSYVGTLGGGEVDASLLLLAVHGYTPADSPRMRSTLARIRERLEEHGALHRRRVDEGGSRRESAFIACGFWGVEALALAGRKREAAEWLERQMSFASDVGLLSEVIDPQARRLLGNLPQAISHVGLINAVCALDREQAAGERSSAAA